MDYFSMLPFRAHSAQVIVVDLLSYLLQLQEDIEEGIEGIEVRPVKTCI